MILFYTSAIIDKTAQLEADEYTHCIKVLRHKQGDQINITDGNGVRAKAEITEIKKSMAVLTVIEAQSIQRSPNIYHLAIAPPKSRGRWEWLLEKAVEIGVDKIIPLKTKNSERIKLNLERGQKIMRSAALQSLRSHHPSLGDISSFKNLIQDYNEEWNKLIAHYKEENENISSMNTAAKKHLILIGPEGDFTIGEIDEAVSNGFNLVNISQNRLRTETAGVVAINLLVSK